MNKNKSLISFGKINKYFIVPFLCPIFCFLANYFIELYLESKANNEKEIENKIKEKIYLLSSTVSLSYFGGGLLYFISYIRTKTTDTKKSINYKKDKVNSISGKSLSPNSIEYLYNAPLEQKNILKIFPILFIMSLLVIFALICSLFSYNKKVF